MSNLKKTAVAVLALGSSAVFAGTMGPVCTPGSVTVPCERSAWDFGARALVLKPMMDADMSYVGSSAFIGTGFDTVAVRDHDFDADWGWGFMIEGSYHFNTGNDLNLNWYHYSKDTTNRYLSGVFTPAGDLELPTRVSIEPKWDAVNLEFGQHVDFGEFKNIRFHGGVQYARIEHEGRALINNNIITPLTVGIASNTKYNGFGPRVGADMSYDWGNGFGIYANGATAILAGSSKYDIAAAAALDGDVFLAAARTGSKDALVPEMEAKLGATYNYAMAQGDLMLDVGWMWVNYFNANYVRTIGVQESDFGVTGLYFGGKWVGNIA
ncbi:major outer membrane protein [Legionella geestiana]|uniref:Major outer membrane protein n=1 Tax=Legionella geestiana TaxID=45065 RepID=A0A0W0U998_9GAMM|nr:Lpg1974 family pore-forming outer membrane protein [Legionella geestiana]KTD04480.1 major outer membrane protein [Legionella geestiana]QBS12250.1 hypothetical protein E4T54_05540 [Legionella geestiana]QDQ40038.1 hypothetical protein E3226_006300 [Legionella geestiana]STX53016.1 major outer membrane protein [Legionella geestiana]